MAKRKLVVEVVEVVEVAEKRPRFEVEPPRRPHCPRCGSDRLRVAYTTVFREEGFRRTTADCVDCGAICWWDSALESKKNSMAQ